MGIISFIKGGVAELAIARPDSAKDQWVYKHPDQTIPMKAQLTVDSDEVALFFKDGKYVGAFSAGRHTLDASNILFLGQLVDKFTGGNVFICEVFFVTTRELASIKFGTSIGDVQDPQTQLRVRIMVHGEFSAKVIDPAKLVIGLVGQRATSNEGFVGWFKSQVQKTMKDGIAELIVKENWPLMKVTSGGYTDEIEATRQLVRTCRPDDIGISVSYPLPGTRFHERVRDQMAERQNWEDSGDLSMLYEGAFPTSFYRDLHEVVHKEFRRRQAAATTSPLVHLARALRVPPRRQRLARVRDALTLPSDERGLARRTRTELRAGPEPGLQVGRA